MRSVLWLPILVALVGCVSSEDDEAPELGGPCYVEYQEPVVGITSVVASGAPLADVELLAIRFAGRPFDPIAEGVDKQGLERTADGFRCTLPCAFSTTEGLYELVVGAPGQRAKTVQVLAKYERHEGSCPATLGGGTRVAVRLDENAQPD